MGSNLQSSRSLNRQYTTPGEADSYHVSHTDDSANSSRAKRSVASAAARGPILGSPPDTSSKPILPEPTSPHKTRQTQHRAPSNADPVMLEQPLLIPRCRDLHAGHESHGSSIINFACAYEDNFPARWVPHQTPVAKTTSAQASAGMRDYDVEPLDLCYQRMVGVDDQIQCYEPEESGQSDDEGLLMMKSSNTASKFEAGAPGVKKCAADSLPRGQHEDQKYPKPFPQHIPKIHVQAVTPPDSKLFLHLAQDTITTGRPSPTPAPIASGKNLSPVALATTNRLPQRIALETPEYTFVSHYDPFNQPSATSIPLRDIPRGAREEVRGFTPKLESFTNWSGNPSLQSIAERVKTRVQPKVNRAYNPPYKRTTLPDTEISDSFLRGLIPSPVSVGVGLTNSGSIITKNAGHPVAESGQAAPDQGAATLTAHGFECPPQNFIHEHFTKEALRCRWEISQSYTQWPKLKISKRDGPALHFSEMEENYGVFLRQRL